VPLPLYEYRIREHSRGRAGNRHHGEVLEDLRRLNAPAFTPAALMEAKRRWCPALTIRTCDKQTSERLQTLMVQEPTLDAQVIDENDQPLGKVILNDAGGQSFTAEAVRSLLRFVNDGDKPEAPAGWKLSFAPSWRGGLDPTGEAARRNLEKNDLAKLGAVQEELWRLSCPAWVDEALPPTIDEFIGENARARYAVQRLRERSLLPYAVFGAGSHTQRLLASGALSPLPAVIFDDRPPAENPAGIPVVQPGTTTLVRAVIVSSDAHERELFARAQRAFAPATPIIRLYS